MDSTVQIREDCLFEEVDSVVEMNLGKKPLALERNHYTQGRLPEEFTAIEPLFELRQL